MTSQICDILHVDDLRLSFGDWHLYAVIRGVPTEENSGWGDGKAFEADPGDPPWTVTCNWKGYRPTYRLTREGKLALERFDFDNLGLPARVVNETLVGDFFMVMKTEFMGPRLYVRFCDGFIVRDRDRWLHEVYVDNSLLNSELRKGCPSDFPPAPDWLG